MVRWATIVSTTTMTVSVCLSGLSALSGARGFRCSVLAWPCRIVALLIGRLFGSAIRMKATGMALNSRFVGATALALTLAR